MSEGGGGCYFLLLSVGDRKLSPKLMTALDDGGRQHEFSWSNFTIGLSSVMVAPL